jgi:nicotinate-nucleotide pyrophosphorylase (carboxylating)
MQLQLRTLHQLLDASFKEDYGTKGDITSNTVISSGTEVKFAINARQNLVLCGIQIAQYYFKEYSSIKYQIHHSDSETVKENATIISGSGEAREVLLLERIILNYLQHLSGIATTTSKYVELVRETKAQIFDTRKTIPMLRQLQKYAVTCGGGYNHRLSLDSSILIKDNHIAICGGVTKALKKAKLHRPHYTRIEIECDTIEQIKESLAEGVDIIMLDNMSIDQIHEAVKLIGDKAIIEASGNVSLETVKAIAHAGVDIISVGKITHSPISADIGLDII